MLKEKKDQYNIKLNLDIADIQLNVSNVPNNLFMPSGNNEQLSNSKNNETIQIPNVNQADQSFNKPINASNNQIKSTF
jgi:hypothetical protein